MILYLDSSAIVKLVRREPETSVLRRYLRRHADDRRVTSALARVEVVRAVAAAGTPAVAHARRQLAYLDQMTLHRDVLDAAAGLEPGTTLRSLDAIHLASAQTLGTDLRAVVTYDARMTAAAATLGLVVAAPA